MPGPVVASLADGHGSAIVASLECIVAPDLCAGDDRFRCRTDVDPTRNVCLRGDKPLERAPVFSRPRGVLIVLGGLLVANLLERSLLNHSRTSQYAPGVVRAVVAIGHDMGMARRLAAGGRKAARVLAWIAGQSLWCRSYWTGRGKSVGRICLGCMHARFPACWASEIGLLLGWRVPALPPRSDLGGQHGVDVSEVDAAAQQSHVARTDEMRLAYEARARMLVNASHWIGACCKS